jgi:hypothetical protein
VEANTLWKLKTGTSVTNADNGELYDLRTNPGEEEALNCLGTEADEAPPGTEPDVSLQLFGDDNSDTGLVNWYECVSTPDDCTTNTDPAP